MRGCVNAHSLARARVCVCVHECTRVYAGTGVCVCVDPFMSEMEEVNTMHYQTAPIPLPVVW